jgi:hypothetical protein
MSFWQSIKQGFGYGFGGTLGWHLANLVAYLLRKLWTVVGIAALGGVMSWYANSNPAPQPVKEKPAVVKKAGSPATERREIKPHSSDAKSDLGTRNPGLDR